MTGKHPPFVMLTHGVFDSDAYRDLSSKERDILWLLIRRHDGRNNGAIPLGTREAASWCHCTQPTACRALQRLERSGLISTTDKGRLVPGGTNRASRWRLNFLKKTDDQCDAPVVS